MLKSLFKKLFCKKGELSNSQIGPITQVIIDNFDTFKPVNRSGYQRYESDTLGFRLNVYVDRRAYSLDLTDRNFNLAVNASSVFVYFDSELITLNKHENAAIMRLIVGEIFKKRYQELKAVEGHLQKHLHEVAPTLMAEINKDQSSLKNFIIASEQMAKILKDV